jgi:hypothetical protein
MDLDNLSKRLRHLKVTFLPDDLLAVLDCAQRAYHRQEYVRANALLNIVERVCQRRGIPIHNKATAPRHVDYKKIRLLYGREGLQCINQIIDKLI